MGSSAGLFAAQVGLGSFSALSGRSGAKRAIADANQNYLSDVAAAGRNYTLQNEELNRQLAILNIDETEETSLHIREANGVLSSLANSFGILDGATSNNLYRSELFGFNSELQRISTNFDRDRGAVRADKAVNRQNYSNAVLAASSRRRNIIREARRSSTQSAINAVGSTLSAYGQYRRDNALLDDTTGGTDFRTKYGKYRRLNAQSYRGV